MGKSCAFQILREKRQSVGSNRYLTSQEILPMKLLEKFNMMDWVLLSELTRMLTLNALKYCSIRYYISHTKAD